jgi:hypothetical protein
VFISQVIGWIFSKAKYKMRLAVTRNKNRVLGKSSWPKQLTLVFGLFGNCRFKKSKAMKKEDF